MCRLLFQPRTYGAACTEKMSQLKLTAFEMVVKGYPSVLSPSALKRSTLLEGKEEIEDQLLKDPSQARLCYCFDLKFAIRLLVERDKTSTVQLVKI